jgi:hypothetical protein
MLHPSLRYTRAFTPQPAQLRIPLTSPAMPHTEKLLKSCKLRLLLPRLRHIAARKGSAIFGNVIAIFFPNSAIQFPQFSACVYRLRPCLSFGEMRAVVGLAASASVVVLLLALSGTCGSASCRLSAAARAVARALPLQRPFRAVFRD